MKTMEMPAPYGLVHLMLYCYFKDLTVSSENSMERLLDFLGEPLFGEERPTHYRFVWKRRLGKDQKETIIVISFGIGMMMVSVTATSKNLANRFLDELFAKAGLEQISFPPGERLLNSPEVQDKIKNLLLGIDDTDEAAKC